MYAPSDMVHAGCESRRTKKHWGGKLQLASQRLYGRNTNLLCVCVCVGGGGEFVLVWKLAKAACGARAACAESRGEDNVPGGPCHPARHVPAG